MKSPEKMLFILLASVLALTVGITSGAKADDLFVKLDAQARELPISAQEWFLVKDISSGLIWETKSGDGSVHDQDNLYSWKETSNKFLDGLNKDKFGGFDDWRLPEESELAALSKISLDNPEIFEKYFPRTAPTPYWSWTYCQDGSVNSLQIKFGQQPTERKRQYRARAVRGELRE